MIPLKSEICATKSSVKSYGKIVLTLENCLLSEDKFTTTPSQIDGLAREIETDLRMYGCELIQTAGILLRLPQTAMATGQVLLQRFYYSKSLVRHPMEHTAMACVCLASKIEECPRRVRDVVNVFHHIRQVTSKKPIQPMILDQNYITLKTQVIKAERRVLKELGFCVHVKHPHKIIVMYLQVLSLEKNKPLMQLSWNYMNDSLKTDVFVRYQPEVIACACIFLTARKLKLPLPKKPAWYTVFGVQEKEIKEICLRILRLYNRPKPSIEALEKKVQELCKQYQEAKVKAKLTENNIQCNFNSNITNLAKTAGGTHNAWGGFISRSVTNESTNPEKISTSHSPKHHKRYKNRTQSPHKKKLRRRSHSRSRSGSPQNKRKKNKFHHRTYDKMNYEKNDFKYDKENNKHEREKYREDDRYLENEKYERKEKYHDLLNGDKYYDKDKYKKSKYVSEENRNRDHAGKDRRR